MAKSKVKKEKPLSPKKEIRNKITGQLKTALAELEERLGSKEFESRIKKAAKLLSAGIKATPVKAVKKKAEKKETTEPEAKAE